MQTLKEMKISSYCLLFILLYILGGCDFVIKKTNDFEKAQIEISNNNWTEAERLLGRYLKEQETATDRWEAWNELIDIINKAGSEPRITLEYLGVMLYEFEDDPEKYKNVLYKIGLINEDLWLYETAIDVWLTYINLESLSGEEAINAHRQLAKIYYLTGNFESAIDILNNCLALDVNPNSLALCMYDLTEVNIVQGKWKEASDLAIQILEMEVQQKIKALTLFLLADSLEQQEKLQEALQYFEQCKGIYPNEAVVIKRIEYLHNKLQ